MIVKPFPKNKKPNIEKLKIILTDCRVCKQSNMVEFKHGYFCPNCEFNI